MLLMMYVVDGVVEDVFGGYDVVDDVVVMMIMMMKKLIRGIRMRVRMRVTTEMKVLQKTRWRMMICKMMMVVWRMMTLRGMR